MDEEEEEEETNKLRESPMFTSLTFPEPNVISRWININIICLCYGIQCRRGFGICSYIKNNNLWWGVKAWVKGGAREGMACGTQGSKPQPPTPVLTHPPPRTYTYSMGREQLSIPGQVFLRFPSSVFGLHLYLLESKFPHILGKI